MSKPMATLTRRGLIASTAAAAVLSALPRGAALAADKPHLRQIPKTGVEIPALGMGTWITFNVGDDPQLRAQRAETSGARSTFCWSGSSIACKAARRKPPQRG